MRWGSPFFINDRNQVSDDYGTIAGGARNLAGNTNGTPADSRYATVGGGDQTKPKDLRLRVAGEGSLRSRSTPPLAVGRSIRQLVSPPQ